MKYQTLYLEAPNAEALTMEMNQFFKDNPDISIRDVSYLTEARVNRLNPGPPIVVFISLITYKRPVL